ncbi:MAG: LysR family transcriptional regulator [Clostridiales bacterium]|nr:LysR family transcriptional regulator [Clostridiales bacterium]
MSYLKKYEYVSAVLEYGGITQAAEQLKVSQPTFSKYLKKIETDLGVELFDRSRLPIRLTKAGECFYQAGKRFLDMDRQLNKQLDEIKETQSFNIRVGVSPSRYPYMLPKIMADFMQKVPKARVVVVEKYAGELNRRLIDGDLDIIISILSDETRDFERIELFDENLLLAVPKDKCPKSKDLNEIFSSLTFIRGGTFTGIWKKLSEEIISNYDVSKSEILCQSVESAFDLVKQGLGVSIVPSYMVSNYVNTVEFLPLYTKVDPKRKVCLFYRKEQFISSVEKTFIDCVINAEKK